MDIAIKGQTHQFLPQLNGGVWQLQDGVCLHESIICHLSTKEWEESSRAMRITQRVGWWDHLRGIPIQAPTLVKVKAFSSDVTNLTLSSTIVKNKHKAPMVGIGIEGEASISI